MRPFPCAAAAASLPMFVATTLALSLVFSPLTALTQAPVVPAPAAGPSATGPSATPASAPAEAKPAAAKPGAAAKPAGSPGCAKLDYRARVEVDVSALGPDGQGLGPRLKVKAEEELKRNDIMGVADGADAPVLRIKLDPLAGEDGGFHFTIDINHAEQHPIKDSSSVGECSLCTESELEAKIVGTTRGLTPKLRAYVADYNNRPCPSDGPPACETDANCKDPAQPKCSKQLKQCVAADECAADADCTGNSNGPACHPVIKKCVKRTEIPPTNQSKNAGIGLIAGGSVLALLGVGGLATGIGFIVVNETQPDPMNGAELLKWRPPGIGLAIGGALLAAGGGILIWRGVKQRRNQQVAPVAGAGFYGLSWSGRF